MATRAVEVLAHEPGFHQPNDLAVTAGGVDLRSDPDWRESTGRVWRVDPGGAVTLLARMGTTNGIEVGPGERTLYVNESVQRSVWAFDLEADGTLGDKRLLIRFADHGLDGMRCDVAGNLYVTRYGKGTVARSRRRGAAAGGGADGGRSRATSPSEAPTAGPATSPCRTGATSRSSASRSRTRLAAGSARP